MHELSLCHAIASIATRHATGRPVRAIGVRVGQLRQVVPDTLVYCWSLMTEGTTLDGSVLEIESVPARIECGHCGHSQVLSAVSLACDECGGHDVAIVAGEEFLVTTLDLAEA